MSTENECWSVNDEDFRHNTLGDLLDEECELLPGQTVYRGTAKSPDIKSFIDVDSVIENIGERAWDVGDEYADGYPDATPEHKAKLQKLLEDWLAECPAPTFYSVIDSQPYVLAESDFDPEDLQDRRANK